MEIEAGDRYGNKRSYHKPNGGSGSTANKVCFHWRAGRCNRHPCPYLHSELPQTLDSTTSSSNPKRPFRHQNPNPIADTRSHGLVWRNPNTGNGGGGGGGASKWGGKVNGGGARQVQQQQNRLCKFFLSGTCSFGESCKFLHSWFQGDSFSLLTLLQGHQKVITCIALPSGSDKLYSGSKDETVRVWDCQTGQCVGVVNMGGEVGCMINEGPWIFVGITNAVKAWNTQTATDLKLDGPAGQVYALVVGNGMLFAGIQDGCILAWKFNAAENCFQPAASLTGHRLAVVSLVVGGTRLYSGSMDHTIRVWDLATLQCIQTLTDHTSVVMSLLCWDQFLLSCSLDKTIKIWVATESGNLEVTYTHDEEHGVLALCGMPDAQAKPVLFSACNDNSVRLYDLPSFCERGKIFSKEEVRAIQIGPGGLFFTGDGTGELKVWKWMALEASST